MSRTYFVGLITILSLAVVGCGSKKVEQVKRPPVGDGKLKITDVKVGDGAELHTGDAALVLYTGKLTTGKVFDSNEKKDDKGQYEQLPLGFVMGNEEVIPGWEKGLEGMKVGGERTLVIPPNLAYGDRGSPPDIGPGETLNFNIKLLDVVKKGEERIMDSKDNKIGSGREAKEGDQVEITYIARLCNGFEYENSKNYEEKMIFKLGSEKVSASISAGIVGMKEGGVRTLRLPQPLWAGIGSRVYLPPPQVLYYEITLKKVG